jgi:hypothetical protein
LSSTDRQGRSRGSSNTIPTRAHDAAAIIAVETGDDPEHRGLAAAGRADEHGHLATAEHEADVAQHLQPLAGGSYEGFLLDLDIKQRAAASGTHVVQRAAP